MRKAAFVYTILAFTLYSCIKPPTYSIIPAIAFVSVSSSNITSGFADTITFSFTDGDGDIGVSASDTNTSDSVCCGIQPAGKYKAISGTIEVIAEAYNTKCFGGCPCAVNDTVTYAIILRDMAGHLSNTIHTTPIAINCN